MPRAREDRDADAPSQRRPPRAGRLKIRAPMFQLEALGRTMLEQGFLFAFLGLGVLITFRFFRFPDLTAEGSYPLGGAVAAALILSGWDPFSATVVATLAGSAAGIVTALVHTKLKINNIIAGIIVMT